MWEGCIIFAWMEHEICITYQMRNAALFLLVLDSVSRYFGNCIGKQIMIESFDSSFLSESFAFIISVTCNKFAIIQHPWILFLTNAIH